MVMKQIIFLLFVTFICACQKPSEPMVPEYDGKITAQKNGETWTAEAYAVQKNSMSSSMAIFFRKNNEKTGIEDKCVISNIPFSQGIYEVGPNLNNDNTDTSIYGKFYFKDYDIVIGSYNILGGNPNSLTLESYDAVSKEFRGSLDLIFIVDQKSEATLPDTIRISKGVFHGKLIN